MRGGAIVAVAVILLALAPRALFAGSPFYLTVDRSFAGAEKPEVRLDYTVSKKPLQLRVLRPKNLERFLDGQLHISRSYEAPISELNPGHYFATGLNKAGSPLRTFRSMLDSGFRQSLKETPLHEAVQETTRTELVSPPEQVILRPPEGFDQIQERFVDLEYGGEQADDLGWWFADGGWEEDRYKIRKIEFDPLPDGVYLLQAVQGKTEAQCLLQVSSLSVQVKQSSEQLVVRVIDRELSPVAGAAVSYRDGRGMWQSLGETTNTFGEVAFANREGLLDGRLVIKAETKDLRRALVETDFLPTAAGDNAVFVTTDRPIFKPGESFSYKGVVRTFAGGELQLPHFADSRAAVTLIRADGTPTDLKAEVPLTGFGSFSGSFDLDEAQVPGLYRLVAEIDSKPYGGEFRVRDYVKPTFYLELIERSPSVVAGEPFVIKFKARRYSGGVPQGVKYEVFFYRKKFEVPQFVVEAGGGLSAEADYHGEIRSATSLTEPKRIYSSVEERLANLGDLYATNTWDTAPLLNDSGEGEFSFEIPKIQGESGGEWIYSLMVRAMDPAGSLAVLTDSIFATFSEAQPAVQFASPVAQTGDKEQALFVRTTYPDGKPAPRGSGVVDFSLEQGAEQGKEYLKLPFVTDGEGSCRIVLPELAVKGRLTAIATLEKLADQVMRHTAESPPAVMIVGGAAGETILDNQDLELYTANTVLSPGDKARVFALLPAGWGKNEKGTVWETIAGSKVYDTRMSEFQGRSGWFEVEAKPEYGTGFYHTVTVPMGNGKYREQTLGFRIIPREKRLDIAVLPERETAEPLKPFRIDLQGKDVNGRPAADTELAVTIVDRAVYAVQGELRPQVFDFFYPLPRLNLATFYSDDLQGYGYADLLKKPNFQLGALKGQSKLTKKAMRDTAGWFPHVVTDGDGRATITVDMPANITEWVVTAIAADKAGRVGEAKGHYRSVADLSAEVLAPQFLRTGEEAQLLVKTVNHLAQPLAVTTRLDLAGEARLRPESLTKTARLAPKGEQLMPVVLAATGEEGAATLKVALSTEENVHVGGAEEFEIPLKPAVMAQTFAAVQEANLLKTALPEEGEIRRLDVRVHSGLLGAALNSAAVLVSYPYGCIEQLVHSTVPNLVLMDLVGKADIKPDRLGPLAGILTRAERNAAVGVKKIVQKQKSDGSFALWANDAKGSLPVTLTALSALKFAEELKIEGAERAVNKGLGWLNGIKGQDLDRGGALLGYELSRLSEVARGHHAWQAEVDFVKAVWSQADGPLLDLIHALRIFAANRQKRWSPFNEAVKGLGIEEDLVARLQEVLNNLDPEGIGGDASPLDSLGFCFQVPSIVSAGLGILDELGALSPPLEAKLKTILLSRQRNGWWISTFDTGQVIFNTRKVLAREAAAAAQETETRTIMVRTGDGRELGSLSRIPAGFVGSFARPGDKAELAAIELTGLRPAEIAQATVTADLPFSAVVPQSQGVAVVRDFFKITAEGSRKLDPGEVMHVGDLIASEVRVRQLPAPDRRTLPSRFVVVEDTIPSFATGIDDDQSYLADAGIQPREESYWNSIKETRRYPERTVRIGKVVPGGELRSYQVWRVAFKGMATIPPARAFDMYDESRQGNTEAHPVRAE